MTFLGVGYGAALAYSGQMPEEKYFKGKNLIPAPKIIPIPLPEQREGSQTHQQDTTEPNPTA